MYVFLCKPVEKGKNVDYLCVNVYGSRGHIFHVTAITAQASGLIGGCIIIDIKTQLKLLF